jgi:hypothetical protein
MEGLSNKPLFDFAQLLLGVRPQSDKRLDVLMSKIKRE